LNDAMTDASTTPERVVLLQRLADLSQHRVWAQDGIGALAGQHAPSRDPSLPVVRDLPDALRSAIRVGILFAVSGVFFIVTGWPATAGALSLVASLASLSMQAPSSNKFANAALIAIPLAIASGGLVRFGLLNAGQGFPLLAIAMAPPIFIACFLGRRVQSASIGNLLLIFFPIMLAPTNPQSYDPNGFITLSVLALTASVLVFVLLHAVLPTSDIHRRRWSLQAARADLAKTFQGRADSAEKRIVVDGHRVAQMPLKQPAQSTAHQRVL
jgi:uncharacterized membrane protein YccC